MGVYNKISSWGANRGENWSAIQNSDARKRNDSDEITCVDGIFRLFFMRREKIGILVSIVVRKSGVKVAL
jgi:hypothetical protein